MPPKARITRDMIVEEAFQIARTEGADKITVRRISQRLQCSTQPVLYSFATVEEIRQAVYHKANAYHSEWLMNLSPENGNPMLQIGMNYIRFATDEGHLFRFLFQSDSLGSAGVMELAQLEELEPIVQVLQKEADVTPEAAREIFMTLFVFVHGYASLFANNAMEYDQAQLADSLTKAFYGAVYAAKEVRL